MAQNLDYEVQDSWCYNNDPANCRKYGRLYTWEAAKQACAAVGWRLPKDAEWSALQDKFGGKTGAYNALINRGSTGFSALIGGYRSTNGSFSDLGWIGFYWSGTEGDTRSALYCDFGGGSPRKLNHNLIDKALGFSCRCVQD